MEWTAFILGCLAWVFLLLFMVSMVTARRSIRNLRSDIEMQDEMLRRERNLSQRNSQDAKAKQKRMTDARRILGWEEYTVVFPADSIQKKLEKAQQDKAQQDQLAAQARALQQGGGLGAGLFGSLWSGA